MADISNTSDNSAKKSGGFSFRKKRSTSKTRKEAERKQQPVDPDAVNNETEFQKTEESHQQEASNESPEVKLEERGVDKGAESEGALSCGEDASPNKSDNASPAAAEQGEVQSTKKKSKTRRSRSLFKRSSKHREGKSAERSDQAASAATGESAVPKDNGEEAVAVVGSVDSGVRDEVEGTVDSHKELDTEYCGGEASETDGEFAGEDEEDGGYYLSGNETGDETKGDAKKEDSNKSGTKKKGFFKRGLSLRRSKGKKKRRHSESDTAENKVTSTENEAPVEKPATILKPESASFATQTDNSKENNEASEVANNDTEATQDENQVDNIEKKPPQKPARKVSFAAPHKYHDSEGDSPTEEETGNNAPEDAPTTSEDASMTSDDAPKISEDAPITSEGVLATSDDASTTFEDAPIEILPIRANPEVDPDVRDRDAPEVVIESEETVKQSEIDDDELTEVSSLATSTDNLASQICDVMPEPFVFTGTEQEEETGSRITLVESGEIGEGSGEKFDDAEESRQEKDDPEVEKLLQDPEAEKVMKEVEWTMLQKSCDMSGDLSRVRKHTLFSVKRLCCSVM